MEKETKKMSEAIMSHQFVIKKPMNGHLHKETFYNMPSQQQLWQKRMCNMYHQWVYS